MDEQLILIIDDNDNSEELRAVQRKCRTKGVGVKFDSFDPESDFDTVKIRIKKDCFVKRYSFIGCDFQLRGKDFNGLSLTRWLTNVNKHEKAFSKRTNFFMFTGNLEKMGMEAAPDIVDYMSMGVSRVFDRGASFVGDLATYVEKMSNKMTLQNNFLKLMGEHQELLISSSMPHFEGRTLGEINAEIEKNTDFGRQFQEQLAEQTVAHLVNLISE